MTSLGISGGTRLLPLLGNRPADGDVAAERATRSSLKAVASFCLCLSLLLGPFLPLPKSPTQAVLSAWKFLPHIYLANIFCNYFKLHSSCRMPSFSPFVLTYILLQPVSSSLTLDYELRPWLVPGIQSALNNILPKECSDPS